MALLEAKTNGDIRRCDAFGNNCVRYTSNTWDDWVRWVVLAVIIGLFLLTFFFCSCVTARRRRRMGQSPLYGTGWAARNQNYNQNTQPYYGHGNQYPPPPPEYSTSVPNGHQQYYGGQQSGIELQAPSNVYAPGRSTEVYQPPVEAPPVKKGDGMIR
jgi:hypothetical protein